MLNRDKFARLTLMALAAVATTATAGTAASTGTTASATAGPAPAASDNAAPELQEIVVTGTMIKRPDAETAEAITTVSMQSLKDLGITTVEQAIQQIAANQASGAFQVASSVSTFTGGGSFANLRGLGSDHTLVLLDGQRLANNVSVGDAVDITGIPFAAIDHIEVLREGASSLYGTDAIGGVINFITKKDYDKGELEVNFSKPQHAGADSDNLDATFGHGNLATDGYNFMVTGDYSRQNALTASQRPFAATGFSPSQGLQDLNYPGNFPGSYTDAGGVNTWQVGYPNCAGNPLLARTPAGSCSYLYGGATDLLPNSDQFSGLAALTKTLPGNNTLSVQYFWARSDSTAYAGPYTYAATVNPGSRYFPTAAESTCLAAPCSTATPNLSGPIFAEWTDPDNVRYNENVNTEQRVLVTFAGKNAGWDYTTSFNYSKNSNVFSIPTPGGYPNLNIIAPNGVLNPLINPFGLNTPAAQALINSATPTGNLDVGTLTLWSFNGHAGHELGDAFGAGRPAAFAIGFDIQGQHINFDADQPLTPILSSVTGFSPEVTQGSQGDKAAYVELNVPVTKAFEFTVSDREDVYSDFGETNNAKLSFRYQPFSILTIRGAASSGFRAPSLSELFEPQVLGANPGTIDGPGCASKQYTTIFSQTNCLSQGLGVFGGNPNLQPEKSENFDLGFVIEPIPNLGITVDYYRVLISDEIQAIPALTIYQNPTEFASLYTLNNAGTLSQAAAEATVCPNSNLKAPTCGYIAQTPQNTGGLTTDGFDINANYVIRSDFGNFHVGLDSTVVTQYLLQEFTGGPFLNLVGQFNQGNAPVARWQYTLNLDWNSNDTRWGAGLQNHFVSRYADEYSDVSGVTTDPRTVGIYSIWNGYVSFKPVDPLTVLFGIKNLFDTNPPFSNQNATFQAGYNPSLSDPTGRAFYVNLKYDF
jgi:iron complex outermembrane receptor protein